MWRDIILSKRSLNQRQIYDYEKNHTVCMSDKIQADLAGGL